MAVVGSVWASGSWSDIPWAAGTWADAVEPMASLYFWFWWWEEEEGDDPVLLFNKSQAVTTSDTVNFPTGMCQALYVGTTGTVVAVLETGETATLVGVPAGAFLPVRAIRVNATNTTASNILALYMV